MIPHITAQQVRLALPYPDLIAALRAAFQDNLQSPKRHAHVLSEADASVLLLMPTWQPGGNLGVKLVTVAPANPAIGLPTVHSIFILLDAVTGAPLALLDGEELTLRRTAAASALASTYLSRPESARLLVVGTGSMAPYMAAAHCAARPIKHIAVWGRSQDKAAATVGLIRALGLPPEINIAVAADLATAAHGADIITCATTSTVPILQGDWVQPGTHIDLVGGFKPNMREADDSLMARATVFVDTYTGALAEAGDLIQPLASGHLQRAAIVAELADLVSARHLGRNTNQQVTVFKSVGTGIEDLCAANLVWKDHQKQVSSSGS